MITTWLNFVRLSLTTRLFARFPNQQLTEVRQFNFDVLHGNGSTAEGASKIYLRPETAQGIFVNFLNVQKSGRMKVPFGIAQIGKAFL